MIPSGFFQYIYHIGCGFNLHSIINSGLIPRGQNSSKRQTVLFLPVDPGDKSHKDPDEIDLNVPRHAQYLHNAWKRHQDAVRDRSGRLDDMQDERNTSFSQEINVISFFEELSSSDRTGLLMQLQYKTTLKYVMKPIRSTLMMKYFVKEWRNPLLFMTRIMNR